MSVHMDQAGIDQTEVDQTELEQTEVELEIDIEEMARVRLQHSSYRAIRRVNCVFDAGTLTLTGRLPTYHYKQLAQAAVVEIQGVLQIVNEIQVGED